MINVMVSSRPKEVIPSKIVLSFTTPFTAYKGDEVSVDFTIEEAERIILAMQKQIHTLPTP